MICVAAIGAPRFSCAASAAHFFILGETYHEANRKKGNLFIIGVDFYL